MSKSELTERQKMILNLVIQDYVKTAKPVGSKSLVKKYDLDISSATVRNEMTTLSEAGFLRQPHTSAGRIPTEEGYRMFVGRLMLRSELPALTKDSIQTQFYQSRYNTDEWMKLAASVLANQSQAASIITAPYSETARFKHLQLINTTGRQVLMVIVLMSGKVSQQMLVLTEPVTQSQLTTTANQLNRLFHNHDLESMLNTPNELDALGQDMLKLLSSEMQRSDEILTGELFQDGWTKMLAEPEFAESDVVERAQQLLEERPLLDNLFSQTVLNSEIGGVQVLIGGEGQWEALHDCSLVLARYGVPNLATGILGVVGPTRMAYNHAISTVNFVAGLLSNLVNEVIGEGENLAPPLVE